jgi:hypothetical protein
MVRLYHPRDSRTKGIEEAYESLSIKESEFDVDGAVLVAKR